MIPIRAEAQQLVPLDKQLHLGAWYVIGASTTSFTYYLTKDKKTATIAGIASVVIIGIGKEVYDIKHGTPDPKDLAADVIGGTLGVFTVKINF